MLIGLHDVGRTAGVVFTFGHADILIFAAIIRFTKAAFVDLAACVAVRPAQPGAKDKRQAGCARQIQDAKRNP